MIASLQRHKRKVRWDYTNLIIKTKIKVLAEEQVWDKRKMCWDIGCDYFRDARGGYRDFQPEYPEYRYDIQCRIAKRGAELRGLYKYIERLRGKDSGRKVGPIYSWGWSIDRKIYDGL